MPKRKQRRILNRFPARRFYDWEPLKHHSKLHRLVNWHGRYFYETMKGEADYENAPYEIAYTQIATIKL